MPRKRRIFFQNAYYHVFNRGVAKAPIVLDDHDRKTFMQLLSESVARYKFHLFAYCLMNNHFHLYLQTPYPNLNEALWYLQSNHAHHMNLKYQRCGRFFQDRYKSKLVDADAYSLQLIRYIHQNPYELGADIETYPWSSYPCYLGNLPPWNWLHRQWVLNQFHDQPDQQLNHFRKFHTSPTDPADLERFNNLSRPLVKRGHAPFLL